MNFHKRRLAMKAFPTSSFLQYGRAMKDILIISITFMKEHEDRLTMTKVRFLRCTGKGQICDCIIEISKFYQLSCIHKDIAAP